MRRLRLTPKPCRTTACFWLTLIILSMACATRSTWRGSCARTDTKSSGMRLDSGDCVALSIEARRMLDEAGFPKAKIVCSGDLDEFAITEMKKRGAKIDIWGVGTKLTTGQPDAAIEGIYKLGAVRSPGEPWR